MGTLKFRDEITENNILHFKEMRIGTAFEYNSELYIKITDNSAFDVINLIGRIFDQEALVIEREAEIIFS